MSVETPALEPAPAPETAPAVQPDAALETAPALAAGADDTAALAVVAESGPELVLLPPGSTVRALHGNADY